MTQLQGRTRVEELTQPLVDIYPKDSKAYNLAFDITPNKYVTNLITEKGIIRANRSDILGLKK